VPAPKVDQVSERPFEELVQGLSQQAGAAARAQIDVARRELIAKARQSSSGVAMVGGGAFLVALASGTGTSALILLLARRSGASAAALGVTGAYAGAGALLAREGLTRLREAGPPPPGEQAEDAKRQLGSGKRRTKPAPKPSPKPAGRSTPKSQGARRRTSRTPADRARRRAS
jgi:hypothetical protein